MSERRRVVRRARGLARSRARIEVPRQLRVNDRETMRLTRAPPPAVLVQHCSLFDRVPESHWRAAGAWRARVCEQQDGART